MNKRLPLAFGALVAAILFSASAQGAGHPEKLFNGHNLAGWVVMHNGSLYDVVAPAKNMSKPAGEWNQVRIVSKGE